MIDYAGELTGARRIKPGPSPQQLHARQLAARLVDHKNGRYAVFRGTNGTLALAWQVPPVGVPIGPLPTFIEPLRLEPQGDRNVLAVLPAPMNDDGSVTFAAPGQWIVKIDQAVHVVEDRAFHNAMSYVGPPPELEAAMPPPAAAAAPLSEPEEEDGFQEPPEPENAPRAAPGPASGVQEQLLQEVRQAVAEIRGRLAQQPPVISLGVDGFVREVLADNERLRHENKAQAERYAKEMDWQRQEVGRMTRFLQGYLVLLPGHAIQVDWDKLQRQPLPGLIWGDENYGFITHLRVDVNDAPPAPVDPPPEAPQADAAADRPRRERKVKPATEG